MPATNEVEKRPKVSVKVLGIYGSPRKGGNTDLLLDRILEGAQAAGAEVESIYARKLKISGCIECGSCDDTGECAVHDDMDTVEATDRPKPGHVVQEAAGKDTGTEAIL
jgi:hypothetical protein